MASLSVSARTRRLRGWLGRFGVALLAACSTDQGSIPDSVCPGEGARRAVCPDLPPTAQPRYQLSAPASSVDYPYGARALAPRGPTPGSTVYLSAGASADPEGKAVSPFWNVQDPSHGYLTLEPGPSAWQVSFDVARVGTYDVTLEVTEDSGLHQIAQATLALVAAPLPCAPDGVSPPCDAALDVPGGSFSIGSPEGTGYSNEQPIHAARLSAFALDEYEVTVGRFRRFLARFEPNGTAEGAGAHPAIAGSGWQSAWNAFLPGSSSDFAFAIAECGGAWTERAGDNEARPISCITWYEAFAFCVSEGKRLPTEAEWEYAAAGGDEQRTYPWGNAPPTASLAVFGCSFDGVIACSDADLPVTGSLPAGAGRYGQLDLAGSVWEWTLDSYAQYAAAACTDCANLSDPTKRVFRGGDYTFDDPLALRAASRYAFDPAYPDQTRGVRCAAEAAK